MTKRTFIEIRKKILEILSDGEEHSFGDLERKVDTNWKTIRMHCMDFELYKVCSVENNHVKITAYGRTILLKYATLIKKE